MTYALVGVTVATHRFDGFLISVFQGVLASHKLLMMSNSKPLIAIVGAGVIGLSVGLCLTEVYDNSWT